MAMDTAEIANALMMLAMPAAATQGIAAKAPPAEPLVPDIVDTPDAGPAIFTGYHPADEVIAVFYDPRFDPATDAEITPDVTIAQACTGTQIRLDGELVAEFPPGARIAPEDVALIPR